MQTNFSSPRNRFPKAIPTRSRTRFPMPSSTPSWRRTNMRASPARRCATPAWCVLAGEITTNAVVDYIQVARDTIKRIGYDNTEYRLRLQGLRGAGRLRQAVPGHRPGREQGLRRRPRPGRRRPGPDVRLRLRRNPVADAAADLPVRTASSSARPKLRKDGRLPWLRPDAKSQVTIRYVDGKPDSHRYRGAVHPACAGHRRCADLREAVIEEIIKPVLPTELIKGDIKYLVNPTGRFVVGGPQGDCGLTGRKIIVDTYGGAAPHGGGAFSGKDPSKVDRSAAYAGRYVAKNIVAAGLASKCLVQVAYAIGVAEPTSPDGRHLRHRQDRRREDLSNWSRSTSTCARKASSTCSTCCVRSTRRPPPTATSAATSRNSPGKPPTSAMLLKSDAGL